jgi:hypothetical protein
MLKLKDCHLNTISLDCVVSNFTLISASDQYNLRTHTTIWDTQYQAIIHYPSSKMYLKKHSFGFTRSRLLCCTYFWKQ